MKNVINDPPSFAHILGGMHDAKIVSFQIDFSTRTLELTIDDLNANFSDMPEHEGKFPALMEFTEVTNLHLDCNASHGDTQRVYDLQIKPNPTLSKYDLVLTISPGGRMTCEFDALSITHQLPEKVI